MYNLDSQYGLPVPRRVERRCGCGIDCEILETKNLRRPIKSKPLNDCSQFFLKNHNFISGSFAMSFSKILEGKLPCKNHFYIFSIEVYATYLFCCRYREQLVTQSPGFSSATNLLDCELSFLLS